MQDQYWWWVLALALGIVELLTGTFYLLVLALACAGGGVVALAGGSAVWQLIAAASMAVIGWGALHAWHPARSRAAGGTSDRDVILDIGERVRVARWDESGRSEVTYRGARWQVELDPASKADPAALRSGEYEIRNMVGNRLVVAPVA
jgi:membrane protein implicated in regulation of membrane protease activity